MALLHPESDLSLSVPVMGANIIHELNKKPNQRQGILVDDLMNNFTRRDMRRTAVHFYDTLVFLYAIGVIEHVAYRIYLKKRKPADLFEAEEEGL
ncbi:hypothetical protein [Stenoxybacter acetivorans]|uniref:hypothetical protein n=1 Tax=Stenoxybacter acetivorans TaxID=422441 RepID=UPI000691EABF|nr:hypothetical protein [Stenoxybacter acetivorans]